MTIQDKNGSQIARGIINYSVGDLHKMTDKKGRLEAIHYDHMILSQQ